MRPAGEVPAAQDQGFDEGDDDDNGNDDLKP
jgi:hypothetical protein